MPRALAESSYINLRSRQAYEQSDQGNFDFILITVPEQTNSCVLLKRYQKLFVPTTMVKLILWSTLMLIGLGFNSLSLLNGTCRGINQAKWTLI